MSAKYPRRGLLHQRTKVHHGIGHRGFSGSSFATQTYPKITVTTLNPSYTTQGDTIINNGQDRVERMMKRQPSLTTRPLQHHSTGS
jgi:hypothetical protein